MSTGSETATKEIIVIRSLIGLTFAAALTAGAVYFAFAVLLSIHSYIPSLP